MSMIFLAYKCQPWAYFKYFYFAALSQLPKHTLLKFDRWLGGEIYKLYWGTCTRSDIGYATTVI